MPRWRHEPLINAHPLVNTATTTIASKDLLAFVKATGHEPLVLNLSGGSPHAGPIDDAFPVQTGREKP